MPLHISVLTVQKSYDVSKGRSFIETTVVEKVALHPFKIKILFGRTAKKIENYFTAGLKLIKVKRNKADKLAIFLLNYYMRRNDIKEKHAFLEFNG